ncbi:MAG: DNA cytosine methyltransferase [Candidatus Dormibacteraeota bacterium]|nr:DNA cytosine methyltransferase [Candidatus Dormibacteraeota bacterium]
MKAAFTRGRDTPDKPRLLDLFCCAGGAGVGFARAGFDVVGVDIKPQPNYPFEFIQADALNLDPGLLESFDAVHASPPCQSYSDLAKRNRNGHMWPRLIEPTRKLLRSLGVPYIIENVEGAPLIDPVILCGTMFSELRVIRHRLFESNLDLIAPAHGKHPLVFTHDKRKAHYGKLDQNVSFVQVTGGGGEGPTGDRNGNVQQQGRRTTDASPEAAAWPFLTMLNTWGRCRSWPARTGSTRRRSWIGPMSFSRAT